jgi:hypothetical protein
MAKNAALAEAIKRVSVAVDGLDTGAQQAAFRRVQVSADPTSVATDVENLAPTIRDIPSSQQGSAMAAGLGSPDVSTTNKLWLSIVIGLISLMATALLGIIVLLARGDNVDVVVTAFTALLTGTLGLFAPQPQAAGRGATP